MDNGGQVTSSAHTGYRYKASLGRVGSSRLQVQAQVSCGAAATGLAARVVTGAQAQVSCRLLNRGVEVWTVSFHGWQMEY